MSVLNIEMVVGYPGTYAPTTFYVVDNNGELDIVFTDVNGGPAGKLTLEDLVNNRIATAIGGGIALKTINGLDIHGTGNINLSAFIDGGNASSIYTAEANVIDGGGA